jgi:ABC-type cobalamin/Fe3+-siderophores transport system ATPase subunit
VWKDISFTVNKGECLCLLGPNGCGKTTLLNCINGSFDLKEGRVQINERDVRDYSISDLSKTLGMVFQDHYSPFPYESIEVVRMGRTPHLGYFAKPSSQDTKLAYAMMEELGIAHLAHKSYTHISGGERQLVLIAQTLCQEPEIILFDEPTSHLDFKNQAMVLKTLKNLSDNGMTIVMTSHFPNHAWKVGTHVAMMGSGGIIAKGKVDDVMTEANLTRTYGVDIKIFDAQSGEFKTRFCDPNI